MAVEELSQVMSALAETPAGQSLQKTYRWAEDFRSGQSIEEWRKIMGATGINFTHGILFFNYMRWFLRKESGRFSDEESDTLLWGTIPHDFGEAKFEGLEYVGDIKSSNKTTADEEKETRIAHAVIESLNLDQQTKFNLHNGFQDVVVGKNPKLHAAFKAMEKTEYVFTAMKVFCNAMRFGDSLNFNLAEPMVGRVLVYNTKKSLLQFAPVYPASIGDFFQRNSKVIDAMLAYSLPWLESHREWRGKPVDHPALAHEFIAVWNNFKNGEKRN